MNAFDGLRRELDLWAAQGRVATLWWRDDDASADGPALRRLLDLAAGEGVAVALAVIPAELHDSLPARLDSFAGEPPAAVLQHGIAHRNRAPAGVKKCEFPPGLPRAALLAELAAARQRLATAFGARFAPVLVPPWNRIDASLAADLPRAGLGGLSAMWARRAPLAAPGVLRVNAHCDPLHWRGGRGFVGDYRACGMLLRHLVARRSGLRDADEPTGLLSHHRDMDEASWDFCRRLIVATGRHPAVRWRHPLPVWRGAA